MTHEEPSRGRTKGSAFPCATLAQWVLLPPLLGILLFAWLREPERPELNVSNIVVAESNPLVAVLEDRFARVINAESGKILFRDSIPLMTGEAEAMADFSSRQLLHWPGTRAVSQTGRPFYAALRTLTTSVRFWPGDEIVHFSQQDSTVACRHIFISLRTLRQFTWDEKFESGYGHAEFALVGKRIVGVRRKGGPQAVDAPSPPVTAVYHSLDGEIAMVFDPDHDKPKLDDAQEQRIISHFANRRWKQIRLSTGDATEGGEPILFAPEPPSSPDNGRWNGNHEWPLRDGGLARALGATSGRSRYWYTKAASADAARAKWPFDKGDTFALECEVAGEAAVVGTLGHSVTEAPRTEFRTVYWDLRSGKTLPLRTGTVAARQFDRRLLASTQDSAYWVDLHSGKTTTVLDVGKKRHPVTAYALSVWSLVWVWLVRPTRAGDFSRSFAILLAVLVLAAITSPYWKSLPSLGVEDVGEWIVSGAFLLALGVLVCVATLWRRASLVLLGTAWAIMLFLSVSFAGFTMKEVIDPRPPVAPGAMIGFGGPLPPPQKTTFGNALWYYLSHDHGIFLRRQTQGVGASTAKFIDEARSQFADVEAKEEKAGD